ncbi:MAG: DNA polymerase I [Paludibacteraceae bacterium]|nr:DNA polymerase I [Paludibacteraceae bacterium]
MPKVFLIDAYALIYRSYYALIRTPRINSQGLNTSAVLGFVNVLEDVLKREQPTHLAVAFDPSGPTFRHEADPNYKAQREETPEDIRKSVPVIKELLAAYRIPVLQVDGFEADDVIGTVAHQAQAHGFDVYMLTPDKDYGQLVTDRIKMYRPRHSGGYEIMGPQEVCAKYGLERKEQVIDLLGLMGDSSDNIPGCPGVGEKTAVKLLQQFGSIEAMLERTSEIKGALQQKVADHVEQIRFSKFLATIRLDVPIEFRPDEWRVSPPDLEQLLPILQELEFRQLYAKYTGAPAEAPKRKAAKADDGLQLSLFDADTTVSGESAPQETQTAPLASLQDTPHDYTAVEDEASLQRLVEVLSASEEFCFDTETTSVEVMRAELVGLSFAVREGQAWWVPVFPSNVEKVLAALRPVFGNDKIGKIGQNTKYDLIMLSRYGVEVRGRLFDTMLAHYVLQPELRHGMDYLAEIYLHYRTIRFEEVVGMGAKAIDIRLADPDLLCRYAAEDADVTLRLKHLLDQELDRAGMRTLFEQIEMPLVHTLVGMEQAGVRIDSAALAQSSKVLTAQLHEMERQACQLAGVEFNPASAKQVGEVLFDRLRIVDKPRKTKTGQYQTSEEVLESLRSKHPIVGLILEYRGIKKLLGTYIDALPLLVNPRTGKIHTSYNQAVTATGRLSSSNPNLQNIPVREAMGKEIRKCFVPDPGNVFLSADYSQVELRIMAHLSGDEAMIEAFNEGADVHAATAAKIYKVPLSEVTSDMRRKAKTANFGIIYGVSVFGLGERLGISRKEAKDLIDGYFATYPKVKSYMEASIEAARSKGYVETIFGRKRYLPDIVSHNSVVRGFAERNAINAPIQGSAADIIKIAMARITERFEQEGLRSEMILQVHDELNFNVLPDELERVKEIVTYEMAHVVDLRVPLVADCGVGGNWLEAH